jgi:hypothetical protein
MKEKKLIVKLVEPFTFDGQLYDKLVFTRMKAKHYALIPDRLFEISELSKNEQQKVSGKDNVKLALEMMPLIAAMSGVDEDIIGEMSMADLANVVSELSSFLEESQETGEN